MNTIDTGSGTVDYETVRQAMDGEPFTMSLTDDDEINAVVAAVNQGIDAHLEACFCPDRGDRYEGGKRKAGKLVLCRTLECTVSPESLPDPAPSSVRIGPRGRRPKVPECGWPATSAWCWASTNTALRRSRSVGPGLTTSYKSLDRTKSEDGTPGNACVACTGKANERRSRDIREPCPTAIEHRRVESRAARFCFGPTTRSTRTTNQPE